MAKLLTIVPAGAGSGKTFRIKSDLTNWIREGLVSPDRILAVTFTEAAAAELRDRIRASLLTEGLVHAALAVEQAYVSTIHGLGLRILSEHAFAAGASPRPRALGEAERDLLLRQAIVNANSLEAIKVDLPRFGYRSNIATNASPEDEFRYKLLVTIDLLRGLGDSGTDPRLVEAAVARLRRLYGPVADSSVPLVARLKTAVETLLESFPNDLTGHATSEAARKSFEKDFRSLKRASRTEDLNRDWGLWKGLSELRQSRRGAPTPAGYDDLSSDVIAAASDISVHPGPLEDACAHLTALIHGAQEGMSTYATIKREASVIDYADMICDAERLLRTRSDILGALLSEVDCVIIDEFQDTNPVQFALLWRIAQSAERVLIVGDTKQSIMGFQGADSRLSDALASTYAGSVSPLTANWRSDPRLMRMLNRIAEGLFGPDYIALDPQRSETGHTFAEVLCIPEGRRSAKSRPEAHVAARIGDILRERIPVVMRESDPREPAVRSIEPHDIAVLCPTNALAARYASALEARGIPVRINAPGWLESPAVLAACSALTYAVDPTDRHAALVLLTLGPEAMPLQDALKAIGDNQLEVCDQLAALRAVAETAAVMPLESLLPLVLRAARIAEWIATLPNAAQAHADLMRLDAEVEEFVSAHRDFRAAAGFYGSSAQVFVGWLSARRTDRDFDRHPDPGRSGGQGVEIVTWHASKGREWPIAVVVGLDEKVGERPGTLRAEFADFSDLDAILERAHLIWTPDFPNKEKTEIFVADRREASEADSRRILYVALTRARDRLIFEWPEYALKKIGERDRPTNHAEMLMLDAGVNPVPGKLSVGSVEFEARISNCLSEAPLRSFHIERKSEAQRLKYGELRPATSGQRTPWRVRPSQIPDLDNRDIETREITLNVPPGLVTFPAMAAERGIALHKALRVFLTRPELENRLSEATGLDEGMLALLKAQALALKHWLMEEGYTRIACEVPIQKRYPSGAEYNGVVDLLAQSDHKWLLLDHKSGLGTAAKYAGQLGAYRDLIAEKFNPAVLQVAIHWIDRRSVEIFQQ